MAEATVVRYVMRGDPVSISDEDGGFYRAAAPEDGVVITFTRCKVSHTYYVPLSRITAAIDARTGGGLRVQAGGDHDG